MKIKELKEWLDTLNPDNEVAVDDGGLALIELTPTEEPTGNYLEIGGSDFDAGAGPEDAARLLAWIKEAS